MHNNNNNNITMTSSNTNLIKDDITLNQLLNNNRAENSLYKTHTSIFPRGCYLIERQFIEQFYKLYSYHIPNTITEIPQVYSMLRFDFDIKKNKSDYELYYKDVNKFYDINEIKFVIQKINERIKQVIFCNDEHLTCCLLEKDIYQKNENTMSGGFHLQYPYIFIKNDVVIDGIISFIKDIVYNETSLEFDIGVYKNPWLMYGASKSLELKPYILTKIFNNHLNEMTLYESFQNYKLYDSNENIMPITKENIDHLLPRILSIEPANRETQDEKPNSYTKIIIEPIERKKKKNDDRNIDEKLAECRKLLPLLNNERVETYESWMILGWCLYSIGNGCDEAFDLWDEKSQDGTTYDDTACEIAWSRMKVGNYTIATLHKFARDDNLENYEKVFKKKDSWVKELIYNLTDINCARKFKEFNDGEIFYTESHKWCIFNKETKFWSFNNNKESLIYPISNFFTTEIHNFQKEFVEHYNPKDKTDSALYDLIHSVYKKVGMTKFASGIISQLQSLLTVNSDIMEKFDTNPYLIAFKDGKVIDLKLSIVSDDTSGISIRDIIKEDFLITHTGYNLPTHKNLETTRLNEILLSMVKNKDDLKVVLTALSSFIYGGNINELFYVFTGSGGNGKGILEKMISTVLGNYYKTINITQLTTYEKDGNRANSELAKCQYARCVMTSEPDTAKGSKLITPTIKKWTGNDVLTCRELHGKTFQFNPRFTIAISTNGVPDLSVNDGGIQRRMKIIELPFKFVENKGQALDENEKYGDSSLKNLISTPEYRDAMLFLLINTWIENKGKFYENNNVERFTNEYFDTQNPIKSWFLENYYPDDNGSIQATTLLNHYNSTQDIISASKFGIEMKKICKSKRTARNIIYFCMENRNNDDIQSFLRPQQLM
jgi:phage/plasmid-associated DNA primase